MLPNRPLQAELPLWSEAGQPASPAIAGETLHRLLLEQDWIPYRLRRGRGRRLTLVVDGEGLRIGAPMRLPLHEIENFARSQRDWLRRKLDEWRARPRAQVVLVDDGIAVPLLGRPVLVRVGTTRRRHDWVEGALHLRGGEGVAARLELALREKARELFVPRVEHYARQLGEAAPPVSVGTARTRWGSCSRTGIRLNWRLVHFRREIVDYVIAHEVAHLREMNHSPRFWAVVCRLCPDYQSLRRALRDEAELLPVFR